MADDPRRAASPLSAEELDREAVVTARDLVEDVTFWRIYGSQRTNALLDAELADGE